MRSSMLTSSLVALLFSVQQASAEKRLIYNVPHADNPNIVDVVSSALDGSDAQTLHADLTGLVNLLVDPNTEKLYFRDGTSLKSSNLDGSDVQTLGPAPCISQVSDTALSEDGMRIHAPNRGGPGGVTCGVGTGFLFNWPFNPDIFADFQSVETVPGTGSVFGMTEFCELASMDHDGNMLMEVAEPFPGESCTQSPLAFDEATQKLYAVAQGAMGKNFVRFDLDGTNPEILFPTVFAADLVVDGNKLFWTGFGAGQPNFGLISANLDGSNETLLVGDAREFVLVDVAGNESVPTVSEWGIAAMTLLMLAVGSVIVQRSSLRAI